MPYTFYRSIFGVLLLMAFLVWALISSVTNRTDLRERLSFVPEYRCLAANVPRSPYVRWSNIRYLRPESYGAPVATLVDLKSTSCVPDGDAVSYVLLPIDEEGTADFFRFPGRTVRYEPWIKSGWRDVFSEDASVRYRNTGTGYYLVEPSGDR